MQPVAASPPAPGAPAREAEARWDLTVACLLALLAGPSSLGRWMDDVDLAAHMLIGHALLVMAGALGASALPRLIGVHKPGPRLGAAMIGAALSSVVAWHIPAAFDAADRSELVHSGMHLTYVGAGALLVLGMRGVGSLGRLITCVAANGVMICVALAMASGAFVYSGYGPGEARTGGVAMYVGMQFAAVLVLAGQRLGALWRSRRINRPAAAALTAALVASILVAR